MKKLLSLLAMVGVVGVAGCSKTSPEGVYKFESLVVTEGEEEKTYTCGEGEERDAITDMMCEYVATLELELKDDKATQKMAGEDEMTVTSDYKIEDGKLFMKETDDEEFEEVAKYEDGKIIMEMDAGVKVIFTK